MGCSGCGPTFKKFTGDHICAIIVDQVEGRYQNIIGEITGTKYGWRLDGKVMCLHKDDLTENFSEVPDCTRCGA